MSKHRVDQIGMGIFLIGLAALAIFDGWWPGILFACAAGLIARGVAAGEPWRSQRTALLLIGIGGLFWLEDLLGRYWPLALIVIGVYLLARVDLKRFFEH